MTLECFWSISPFKKFTHLYNTNFQITSNNPTCALRAKRTKPLNPKGPDAIELPFGFSPFAEPPFNLSSSKLSINCLTPSVYYGFAFAQSAADPVLNPDENTLPATDPAILPTAAKPLPASEPSVDVIP